MTAEQLANRIRFFAILQGYDPDEDEPDEAPADDRPRCEICGRVDVECECEY